MQRQQAVQQNNKVNKYLENNKLRPFFHELTKLLLLQKPQDSIQFLLNYLEKRNKRQVICIHGYDQQKRIKLSKSVSNKFNYKVIQLAQLFKGTADWHAKPDKQINQKVKQQIQKVESVYKGIIISGYPNNIVQCDYIQKSGILPDRYFMIDNNQEQVKVTYQNKYDGNVDKLLQRNCLEIKECKDILNELIDQVSSDYEKANEKIIQTIGLKANKKSIPYDSPRIIVLHPPFLKPNNINTLIDTFSLNPISVNSTLKKLSNKPNFITHVQSYIRKHKCISKQIELAMIQTISKNIASKNKGYAILGWPQKKDRLPLLKQHFLIPHLILIFEQGRQNSKDKFRQLSADDVELFSVIKKPQEEQYVKLLKDYTDMIEQLKGKQNVQTFKLGEDAIQIIKTFTNLMENPKIYS